MVSYTPKSVPAQHSAPYSDSVQTPSRRTDNKALETGLLEKELNVFIIHWKEINIFVFV